MKHFKLTIPLTVVLVASSTLYLLQSCGGVHYDSYVNDYKDIAMKEMQRTGYPASIKLAQAILESQGGRGTVALDYNNHFGILCGKNWPGKRYYQEERDFSTGERIETCYRVYNNPESSFVAHTDLMRADFRTLFHKIDPMDYQAWANRLGDLEYSDNEQYDDDLINMIERYRLHEFDKIAMGLDDRPITQETSQPTDSGYDSEYDREYHDEYDSEYSSDYEDRRERLRDKYRESLEDLEDDIDQHRRRYPRDRRQENYRDYEETTYEEEELPRRDYRRETPDEYEEADYYSQRRERDRYYTEDQADRESSTRNSYPRTSNSTRFNPSQIDDKYEGFSDETTTYQRPSRYQEYDRPSYTSRQETNRRQPANRRQETTASYLEDEWEDVETTSISDFRRAEDYAYVNGVKVTTARYDDTPLSIAKRFNVSVKDLLKFNEQIKNAKQLLREDQRVFLGSKKKNYNGEQRYHIVQFGERMKDIADMYGLSLKALYDKNKMPMESEPALGEQIKLDRGRVRKRPELRYKAPKPLSNAANNYSTSEIPPSVPIGGAVSTHSPNQQETAITTVLLQPVNHSNSVYHIVQSGETLYRIAQQYATTTDRIKRMNGLSNSVIKRGMRLKVK